MCDLISQPSIALASLNVTRLQLDDVYDLFEDLVVNIKLNYWIEDPGVGF